MTQPRRRRRALFASLGLVALAAPLVALLSPVAATAAPLPPSIDSPVSPFATVGTTVSVAGSSSISSGTEIVSVWLDDDRVTPVCTALVNYVDGAWTCDASVPVGQHTLTATMFDPADAPGGDSPESNTVVVNRGTTDPVVLTYPADDFQSTGNLFANVTGTGPALGTVVVSVQSRFTPAGTIGTCITTVDASGDWGCTSVFPDYDWWSLTASADDVTGAAVASDSHLYGVAPPKPGVAMTTAPAAASGTITSAAPGGRSSGQWILYDTTGTVQPGNVCAAGWDYGDPTGSPAVAPTPPPSGASVVCGMSLPPGEHLLSSNQWVNDAYSLQRGDLVRVPNTPVIFTGDSPWQSGTDTIFEGTIDQSISGGFSAQTENGGVVVTVSTPEGEICTSSPVVFGTYWSCSAQLPSGDYTIYATATSVGYGPAAGFEGTQGSWTDGVSAPTTTVDVHVFAQPTVTIARGQGTLSTTVIADPAIGEPYQSVSYGRIEPGEEGYDVVEYRDSCEDYASPLVCSAGGPLTPGIWNVYSVSYSNWYGEGGSSTDRDDYVMIPNAPTLTSAAPSPSGVVNFAGASDPGTRVSVLDGGGATVCSGIASGSGAWTCSTSPGYGTFSYRAVASTVGFSLDTSDPFVYSYARFFDGTSTASASRSVVLAPPPTAAAPEAVLAFLWKFGITGIPEGGYHPGDTIEISGDGLPPGTIIFVELHSDPVQLGSAVVDPTGSFTFSGVIPEDVEPGAHELFVTADVPGQGVVSQSQPVTVTAAPAPVVDEEPVDEVPEEVVDDEPETGGGFFGSNPARADPAAPSNLTNGVPTVAHILARPTSILAAGGLALGLLFLLAIPTELLTGVLTENARRFGRGVARVDETLDRAMAWLERVTHGRAAASIVLILLVSIVMGFSDPEFGFDLVSVRAVLALAIGCFVLFYGLSWINGRIAKRLWDVEPEIELKPLLVIFSIVGVVLSRIVDFSPGILLGVVIGLSLSRSNKRGELGVMLLQTGGLVVLSVLSWLGYSALAANGEPTDFGTALLHDSMVALTDEGLTGAAVAILPLAFLEGRVLWERSKIAWAAAFLVVETAFCLIVLPTALEETDASQIGWWYLVLGGFAVVTLALWIVMLRRGPDADDEAEPERESVSAR